MESSLLPSVVFQTSISLTSYLLNVFRIRFEGNYSQVTLKFALCTFKLYLMYLYSMSVSVSNSQLVCHITPCLSGFESLIAPRGYHDPSCLVLPTKKTALCRMSIGSRSLRMNVQRSVVQGKRLDGGISGMRLPREKEDSPTPVVVLL